MQHFANDIWKLTHQKPSSTNGLCQHLDCRFCVEMGAARIEVGAARVEVGAARVEVGAARVEVRAAGVEVELRESR